MKLHKPRIGISLRVVTAPNYDEKRDALSHDWIYFFNKIDAIPIFVPNHLSDLKDFLTEVGIDGLILSGGDNIGDDLERDKTEKDMLDFAIEKKIPVFGVCRGMQVINQYFNGTILINNGSKHVAKPHSVKILSPMSEILKTDTIQVNSYHHNTIMKNTLGKNLKSFAIFPEDSTVEGFYHESLPLSGVMWHPERVQDQYNVTIVKQFLINKQNRI